MNSLPVHSSTKPERERKEEFGGLEGGGWWVCSVLVGGSARLPRVSLLPPFSRKENDEIQFRVGSEEGKNYPD